MCPKGHFDELQGFFGVASGLFIAPGRRIDRPLDF
jgi:hypothetical protein